MIVLVTGSQTWTDYRRVYRALADVSARFPDKPITLIHGDARGADRLAATAAKRLGWGVKPFPCDWSVRPDTPPWAVRRRHDGHAYDVRAGQLRNLVMLDRRPDLVVAFHRAGSPGTLHCVREAERRGLPVERHIHE